MADEVRTGLQSVSRALRALELIADAGELGVTELSRRLDVHKATASRLAATLADHGLIERNPITGRYRLGFGLIRLAGAAIASLDVVRAARPVLEELAEATRETVNLGLLSGDDVVYIDQVTGGRSILSASWVGRRTALHCSASGKVLLAFMSEPERERQLERTPARMTPNTLVDPQALRAQLEEIRVRGYGQIEGELEEGLNAVAAPIRQADGQVSATLSVSGPAFRLRSTDLPRIGRLAIDAATAVSRRLGHSSRRAD